MKIVFFSLAGTFDYFQIGGTDSLVRRITLGLLRKMDNLYISWVFYNSKEKKEIKHLPNFSSRYFKRLKDALDYIDKIEPEHVIACYIHPIDRIKFANFRKSKGNIFFHSIPFFYPESKVKRFMKFIEYRIFPYNASIFCVSKRQYEYIKKFEEKVVYLPPPVPESYFVKPEEKPMNKKIKIAFIGRIDPRKGIREVIEIFKLLKNDKRFELSIYGIHIPWDKEGVEIHNWLSRQREIRYIPFDRQNYTEDVENKLINILKSTDIVILPYKNLDSTVDTPLLLLEAMASLCIVITTPVGSISDLYPNKKFLIERHSFSKEAIKVIKNLKSEDLNEERYKIYTNINNLNIKLSEVIKIFYNYLRLT